MEQASSHFQNIGWAALLSVVAVCMATGCWQEIEYTGPDRIAKTDSPAAAGRRDAPPDQGPADPPVATEPASSDSEDRRFAEDLAVSLTPKPAESHDADDPLPTLDEDDRYALPEGDMPHHMPIPSDDSQPDSISADDSAPPTTDVLPTTPAAEALPSVEPTMQSSDVGPIEDEPLPDQEAQKTAPEPAAANVPSVNTRLAAWQLGSRLSLAALAHDRGVAANNVQQWLVQSKSLAASLGTTVAELPESAAGESRAASRQVLHYLFQEGQQIGRDLTQQHSPRHAALFEVAVKSNLLLVLYQPGSSATVAISAALSEAAPRAELPAPLWQPLLDLLAANAESADVRQAVQRFHADVERHLAEAPQR